MSLAARQGRRGLRLAAAVVLSVNASVAAAPAFGTQGFVERPESELLLLSLRMDRRVLIDTLPAYKMSEGILVPLGAICAALEFPIEVDVAHATADGFFLNEKRGFHLDARAASVVVEGKPERLDLARVEIHAEDIYVDASLLQDWFPIDVAVDLYAATVSIHPRQPLPMQERLERQQRGEHGFTGREGKRSEYPLLKLPYRLFDGPFIDQTVRVSSQRGGDGRRTTDVQYSTFATADLLGLASSVFLFGDRQGISDWRFTLGRKDPMGGLLGPLQAREFGVGDVLFPGLDLVGLPYSGPGAIVSNYPLQLPTQFDRHTFRGELAPGWQIELYRNDALVAFQQSRADGLYEFVDVPILFGLNLFRLAFYGPQGQRREESQTFNVIESLTPPGELRYRLVGNDPRNATRRALLEAETGLFPGLSANLALSSVDLVDGRHDYGKFGLRGFWNRFFATADVAKDRSAGWAAQVGLQTRLGPIGLYLQQAELWAFESERFLPVFGRIRGRSTLRLDGTIPAPLVSRVPFLFQIQEDQLESGGRIDQVTGRLSAFSRGVAVSNQILWTFARGGVTLPEEAAGILLLNKYLQWYSLRGEIDYELLPVRRVTAVTLTAERRLLSGYVFSVGANRALSTGQTHYLASVATHEGVFGIGATADYAREGGLSLGVLLSIGAIRDGGTGKWLRQARSLAASGAVLPQAFLDGNGNGRRDPGEQPIPNARFLVNRAPAARPAGPDGAVLLANLPPDQETSLAIDTQSLEDPLWIPEREGIRIVPRPGRVAHVDFPVLVTGEVTGTVRSRRGGVSREAAGVPLELVDANGEVSRRVTTAFDGFYDIAAILPGQYMLRVAPGYAGRTGLDARARAVIIASDGTAADGIDLTLEESP